MSIVTVHADFDFDNEGNIFTIENLVLKENGISTRFASWEEVEEAYAINPVRLHFARVALERAAAEERRRQQDAQRTYEELRRWDNNERRGSWI